MIKHKWTGALAALLMAAAVLMTGFACLNPGALASVTGTAPPSYASALDKTGIMDIQIVADPAAWASMLENATAEEYIPATVVIDGLKIENVGLRPKGNSSLSMVARSDTTDRFSFKIEFDHYITGQTWLGLDKIVVNNMQGDASYLKEYISYDIMNFAGVASPLFAFADIAVNGASWGFYLAVEALDDSYAQRVYGNDHGALYKPESMGMRGAGRMNDFLEGRQNGLEGAAPPVGQPQQGQQGQAVNELPAGGQRAFGGGMGGMASGGVSLQYTDDAVSSYAAIFDNAVFDATTRDNTRVIKALEKLSKGEDLADAVDVEAVLRYFAAHTVVVNLDSYVSNMGHNYYLYEDDGQLTVLPWDYNLAFGGFQSGSASDVVNFPIDTPVSGVSLADRPILGKLLEVPAYLAQYHSYLRDIVDGYFNSGLFAQTVDTQNALIASHVAADPTAFYTFDAYQSAVAELKELGLLRAQSIEGQLDGTIPATSEGQAAAPDALIDASAVNLTALGSQGGMGGQPGGGDNTQGRGGMGGPQGGMGGFGGLEGVDRETMQKAMEILRAAGEAALSGDNVAQLEALGLTDEQITQLQSMPRRGFGQNGQPPGNPQAVAGNPDANPPPSAVAGFDTATWILTGGVTLLLLAGLAFVVFFRRRRGT